jgi:hypothetical protein
VLRLGGGRVEGLGDVVLPEEARRLPEDLAMIEELLRDEALLFADRGALVAGGGGARSLGRRGAAGRRSRCRISVRLMVLRHRYGWGSERLLREVSRLAAAAPFLPDRAVRGGAGRVDGAEAEPDAWGRGRSRSWRGC